MSSKKCTPRFVRGATRGFGGSTPRFGKVGSIYKKSVSSSVSSPAPLPRSDFDIVKSTGRGVSSRKDSSRSGWMKQKKDDESEAHHRLGFVRSDFDIKKKGCVLKTTSKRFEGPDAYVKKKDYDAGLGMSHGKFESKQKSAVAMKREKHSRFSVYGNIYDTIKMNDVAPISPPHLGNGAFDEEKPSVVFRKSKKEKGRDAWMKTKKEENEADHHFTETRSDFDTTRTNKCAVKMSRRGKHGRFSMLGGIYHGTTTANQVTEPSEIKSTFENESQDKPSAVFVNSKKTDRSGWMKRKDETEASHCLGVVKSDFDKKIKDENEKPSCSFIGTKSRFDMPDSHFKKNVGTSPKSDALGLVHSNVVTKHIKGSVKMKRGKHGRFSMLGSIYNSS